MYRGSTLFLDVCIQRDFWAAGAWPLVTRAQADMIGLLFGAAARLEVRQGGILCLHDPEQQDDEHAGPPHCARGAEGARRPEACEPSRPAAVIAGPLAGREAPAATESSPHPLDRMHAFYVASGCTRPPDGEPSARRVFDHLTAGIRDAVVFGAGLEYAVAHAVDALLRRRIRTHVALDATGAAEASAAQQVIAGWKRRTVDVATAAMLLRLVEQS